MLLDMAFSIAVADPSGASFCGQLRSRLTRIEASTVASSANKDKDAGVALGQITEVSLTMEKLQVSVSRPHGSPAPQGLCTTFRGRHAQNCTFSFDIRVLTSTSFW